MVRKTMTKGQRELRYRCKGCSKLHTYAEKSENNEKCKMCGRMHLQSIEVLVVYPGFWERYIRKAQPIVKEVLTNELN